MVSNVDYKIPDELKKRADDLKLKDHQRKFCELCFSLPERNITEAYCQAYGIKPEKRNYANKQAHHILNDKAKPGTAKHGMQQYYKALQEYFAGLEDAESGKRIADAQDVLAFLTGVMNGKIKDQFDLDAALSDRLNASNQLGRALGMFTDKLEVSGSLDIADAFAAAKKRREERKAKEQQAGEDE